MDLFFVSVVIFEVLVVGLITFLFQILFRRKSGQSVSEKLIFAFWSGISFAVVQGILELGSDGISFVLGALNIQTIHVFVGAGILIVGYIAYWLKVTNRILYGLVEIAVAWFTAMSVSMRLFDNHRDAAAWAALAAAAYIVSRGLENAVSGIEEKDKERLEKKKKLISAESSHLNLASDDVASIENKPDEIQAVPSEQPISIDPTQP